MQESPLLEVSNLSVSFQMYEKGVKQSQQDAISNLSISINRGEVIAIVGSSGSGKSLLAHGILGLLPKNASIKGTIKYRGETLTKEKIEKHRGHHIALIPQSISYLDPLMKIGKQVQGGDRSSKSKGRQRQSFERYDLCEKSEKLYPYQLSGGMARRVLVSTAAQRDVDLIIADEPTPGLDLSMARKTLGYFREFADQGKSVMLITHDVDIALQVADRIAIFYAGTIVEVALVADFHRGVKALRHPYTQALYKALPQNGFHPLPGSQPYGGNMPRGCVFSPRCDHAKEECNGQISMRELRGGMVRCNHAT